MKRNLLWICRILVGLLFIFSGLVKANDPVGFAIKLEEYYDVFAMRFSFLAFFFHSDFMLHTTHFQAAFLCSLEVSLGIALLLGIAGRLVAWLLLLLILFFTWLTGFSAITGSVQDCGCFGDFIKLTPWQSFDKDLVLLALILVIFALRKHLRPLFRPLTSIALFIVLAGFSVWVSVHSLRHDVFFDWRPYAVGDNIAQEMEIPADAPKPVTQMTYTYKKRAGDETKKIVVVMGPSEKAETAENKSALEELSKVSGDSAWQLENRNDKVLKKGFTAKISDFAVANENGEDITSEILDNPDYQLMVVSADFDNTDPGGWKKINAVQQDAEKEGLFTFALVAESRDHIEAFRHARQTAFPFYSGDYKVCLTIARTNPAVLLLKKGTIVAKWSWRDLPDYAHIKSAYFPDRQPTQLVYPGTGEMCAPGEDVLDKLQSGGVPYSGFFLNDESGEDKAQELLSDTAPVYMVLTTDIAKIDNASWNALYPLLKKLKSDTAHYFVVSASPSNLIAEMKNASGLGFDYYMADRDILQRIMPENTGILIFRNGIVQQKYREGDLPSADALGQAQSN